MRVHGAQAEGRTICDVLGAIWAVDGPNWSLDCSNSKSKRKELQPRSIEIKSLWASLTPAGSVSTTLEGPGGARLVEDNAGVHSCLKPQQGLKQHFVTSTTLLAPLISIPSRMSGQSSRERSPIYWSLLHRGKH